MKTDAAVAVATAESGTPANAAERVTCSYRVSISKPSPLKTGNVLLRIDR